MKLNKTTIRFIISMLAILASLGLIVALLFLVIPAENRDIFFTSLGVVLGWGGSGVGYYLNTSQSSQDKTDMMNKST